MDDYSMDLLIWNNGKDYFIDEVNFDPSKKTQFPKGAELHVYSETEKKLKGVYFATPQGNWIEY